MMENEPSGRGVCTVQSEWVFGGKCVFAYACMCARMCPHLCLLSSEERDMVRFIYVKCSGCSPSAKIGCERCQLHALSAVCVTLGVSKSG